MACVPFRRSESRQREVVETIPGSRGFAWTSWSGREHVPGPERTCYLDGETCARNVERWKSGHETWICAGDKDEMDNIVPANGGEKYAIGVGRSVTMKSSKADKSYGAGLGLTKGFAPEAPQAHSPSSRTEMGKPRTDFRCAADTVSWGGDTAVEGTEKVIPVAQDSRARATSKTAR